MNLDPSIEPRRVDSKVLLSLIVPVFNEAETVGLFVTEVSRVFATTPMLELEILFVNDGSSDGTLEKLLSCQRSDRRVKVLDLSRNFGKEAALTAGLMACTGKIVVPIDADLQDPPEVILEMFEKWREGYEVVLGHRSSRADDSWAKRVSANWFYRLHNRIAEPTLPENVGDFRLMDRVVVDALKEIPESRRFMKGLFAWVGFRTTSVEFSRPARIAGSPKFNGWRLWNFALEGVTSFSTDPLRIWTYLGLLVSAASFAFAAFIAVRVIIHGIDVPGYASIMIAVTFLGGLQLIGIGVLGEYLGRTYIESKRRPNFIVRRVYLPRDTDGS